MTTARGSATSSSPAPSRSSRRTVGAREPVSASTWPRLMAEAMGSSLMVWTSSEGTTFTIALPLAKVASELGAA